MTILLSKTTTRYLELSMSRTISIESIQKRALRFLYEDRASEYNVLITRAGKTNHERIGSEPSAQKSTRA